MTLSNPYDKWHYDRSFILVQCHVCVITPCFLHTYDYVNLDPAVKWLFEHLTRRSIDDLYEAQQRLMKEGR